MGKAMRTREAAILAWLAFLPLGQLLSAGFQTSSLWPFNPISVCRSPSTGPRAVAYVSYALTPSGERHIVAEGLCNHRTVRRFDRALGRAGSAAERLQVAKLFFEFLSARAPDAMDLSGIRMDRVEWDLERGEIVGRRVLAEYRP